MARGETFERMSPMPWVAIHAHPSDPADPAHAPEHWDVCDLTGMPVGHFIGPNAEADARAVEDVMVLYRELRSQVVRFVRPEDMVEFVERFGSRS